MQKHSQHNKDERIHFFRKIYLSLYSKGLPKGYVWEVSWRPNKDCNILTPSSSGYSSTSFPFCWAAQPGFTVSRKPSVWELVLTASNCNKLTPTNWTSCRTGLYHCLTSTCFRERRICTQFNPSTVKVIPWYLRPDAPVPWLTAGSKVNMLHDALQAWLANLHQWVWVSLGASFN